MDGHSVPEDLQALIDAHGHLCMGSLLGYKACQYALEILGSSDAMKVVTGGAGCANDAFKVLLNCSAENGRLTVEPQKKQVWAFFNCDEEEGVTLSVNPNLMAQLPADKEQALQFILKMPGGLLFQAEPYPRA